MYNQQPKHQESIVQLPTNRSLLKFILLSIVTLGIYSLVFYTRLSKDINEIAGPHDGRHTMHFCLLAFIISPITCGIAMVVWFHKVSARIGNDLACRGIAYNFGAFEYWLWSVAGVFILVGPLVYIHKLCKAMNLLSADHNVNGYACNSK